MLAHNEAIDFRISRIQQLFALTSMKDNAAEKWRSRLMNSELSLV